MKYRNGLALVTRNLVALFTRAWIEIFPCFASIASASVALFTRAWIEIFDILYGIKDLDGRPLYEGVD